MIKITFSHVVASYMINKEVSAWGASGATLFYDIGLVTDVDKTITREAIIAQGIGDIEPSSNEVGLEESSHTVSFNYQHGRFLEFLLGEASHGTSGSDAGHTFAFDDLPKSMTVESGQNISAGDVGFSFLGQRAESGEISIALNGLLTGSLTVRGKAPIAVDTSIATQTISTLPVFPFHLVTVALNGTAAALVQNFRIGFNKTLTPVNGIGNTQHQEIAASDARIEFSGTLAFSASTFHTNWTSNNVTSITFHATNGTAYGSGLRALRITLTDTELTQFRETTRVGDLTFIELSGIAKLSSAASYDNIVQASWINTY